MRTTPCEKMSIGSASGTGPDRSRMAVPQEPDIEFESVTSRCANLRAIGPATLAFTCSGFLSTVGTTGSGKSALLNRVAVTPQPAGTTVVDPGGVGGGATGFVPDWQDAKGVLKVANGI